MKILSKPEELVLLAVLKLKDNAYGVTIRNLLIRETGVDWSVGAVYVPLNRLARDGYFEVVISEPTAERGGKRKKYYRLTPYGKKALAFTKKVNETMWSGSTTWELDALKSVD
jgi:DNA-binding PadR family transcriptional regulator